TPWHFHGVSTMSGDFSHFIFSSAEYKEQFGEGTEPATVFAPGGVATGIGSAYDNDIAAKTVKIISRLPNGEDIKGNSPEDRHGIEFPGVSTDGSHILMQSKASNGPSQLVMSIDGVSYDVSHGAGVKFAGMTTDGETVYFTAAARLTPDDTDNSVDLYKWSQK